MVFHSDSSTNIHHYPRPHFPAKLWEEMHPLFFLTFWSLSMSDLDLPRESYKREVAKLNDAMALLQKVGPTPFFYTMLTR